jgi:hypothetical protein
MFVGKAGGSTLQCRLLALPANIRAKRLFGDNHKALLKFVNYGKKVL